MPTTNKIHQDPITNPVKHQRGLVIADDSAEMRWLVRAAIGDDFGEVTEAADGRELLWALLRSTMKGDEAPLIVTDLCMPTYDGFDVLDAWRELQPEARAVLITAFPSDAVRDRAKRLGAVLLAKPFSTEALRSVAREAGHGQHDR